MVRSCLLAFAFACLIAADLAAATPSPLPAGVESRVRSALEKEGYPWYDPATDSVKPVWPPREIDPDNWLARWLRGRRRGNATSINLAAAGDIVTIGLAMLALAILLVVLVELWRRYRPRAEDRAQAAVPLTPSRVEGLPDGLEPETDDPWSEAVRCRARGDLARAVVCLFAHQLLTLDRLRQVRLLRGRTGRQLVRTIGDREFRAMVEPTLGLFEAAYYGHRAPTTETFEIAWAAAERFQRRVAGGMTG